MIVDWITSVMTRIICEHSPLCKLFRSKFLSTIVLFYILQSSSSTNIPCGKSFVPCIIDDRRKFLKVIADNYSLNRKSTIIGDVTSSTSPTSRLIVNAPSIPFFMMQSAVNDAKTKVDNLIKQIEQELVFSSKNNGIFWKFIQKIYRSQSSSPSRQSKRQVPVWIRFSVGRRGLEWNLKC